MIKHLSALAWLAGSGLAAAHEGHGLPGASHWHAGDALLFVGLGAVVALSLWLARRK